MLRKYKNCDDVVFEGNFQLSILNCLIVMPFGSVFLVLRAYYKWSPVFSLCTKTIATVLVVSQAAICF